MSRRVRAARGSAHERAPRPAGRTVAEAALASWVVALVATYALDLSSWWSNSFELRWIAPLASRAFLVSAVVVWLVLVLVVTLVGRLWVSVGLLVSATLLLSVANQLKVRLRLEPILPSDLAFLTSTDELLAMVPWGWIVVACAGVVVVLVACVALGRRLARRWPNPLRTVTPTGRRRWRASRAGVALLTVALLLPLGWFHAAHSPWEAAYRGAGATWKPWEQLTNYRDNGFVAGFVDNLRMDPMPRPPGYSRAALSALVERYQERARQINAVRRQRAFGGANVVVVLSEGLADPSRVRGTGLSWDPIPTTHAVMRETRSGSMISTGFGGGTADMEFQMISGLAMCLFAPSVGSSFQDVVVHERQVPSAAWWLRGQGYDTVAIQAFTPEMYQYGRAYPRLGYDVRVFRDQMRHRALGNRSYVADGSVFDEVVDELRARDRPALVSAVTMQNHYPWAGQYADPVPAPSLPGGATAEWRGYLTGLSHSDADLGRFLAALRRLPEDTVVVFYGDHQPGFWPTEVQHENGTRRMHETPYFVWSNHARLALAGDAMPIGANDLLPTALDAVGGTIPPMYALLADVRDRVGALGRTFLVRPDGTTGSLADLAADARQVIDDYRLVQYDLTRGHRWAAAGMWASG